MEGCFFSVVSEFVGLMLAIKGPAKSWRSPLGVFGCFARYVCHALRHSGGRKPVTVGILADSASGVPRSR